MADPFAALNSACVKLGPVVTYQPASGAPFAVRAIPMKDSDEEQHQDGVYARLFVDLADFVSRPDHGDRVTIDGVTHTVFEVKTDAVGGATLSLRVA